MSPESDKGIVGHGKVDINEQPAIRVDNEADAEAVRKEKPDADVRVVVIKAIGTVKRQ